MKPVSWHRGKTPVPSQKISLIPVSPLGPKDIDRPIERVSAHGLAHKCGQSLRTHAEVHRLRRHHDLDRNPSARSRRRLQRADHCGHRLGIGAPAFGSSVSAMIRALSSTDQ